MLAVFNRNQSVLFMYSRLPLISEQPIMKNTAFIIHNKSCNACGTWLTN